MAKCCKVEKGNLKRPLPRKGQTYRHFKGGLYQIISLARHTESDEILVVYKCLYRQEYEKSGLVYARPIGMFLSKVDTDKYPDCQQIYRFELIV